VVEAYVTGIPVAIARGELDGETGRLDYYYTGSPLFAIQLGRFCRVLGVPEMAAIVSLGPVVASVVNPATTVVGMTSSGLVGKPINWSFLIGDSGTGKTPLQQVLTSALHSIQREHNKLYWQPQYETWLKQPPLKRGLEPQKLTCIATNATAEAIYAIQAANGITGFLLYAEELPALMNLDQYKARGGSGRQSLLEAKGGNPASVRRVGKTSCDTERMAMSILGGVQPLIYKSIFDASDPDGFLARFNVAFVPRAMGAWDDGERLDIPSLLRDVLGRIRRYAPKEHVLSPEAQTAYRAFYEYCQRAKLSAPSKALSSIYSKSISEVLARCIELHHLNHALKHESITVQPAHVIGLATFEKAVELCKYQLNLASIMASLSVSNENAERYAHVVSASRQARNDPRLVWQDNPYAGWVSASAIRRTISRPECRQEQQLLGDVEQINDLFNAMARNGYGDVERIGGKLHFRANPSASDLEIARQGSLAPNDFRVQDFGATPTGVIQKIRQVAKTAGGAERDELIDSVARDLLALDPVALLEVHSTEYQNFEPLLEARDPDTSAIVVDRMCEALSEAVQAISDPVPVGSMGLPSTQAIDLEYYEEEEE
jgi:hypothetical protein